MIKGINEKIKIKEYACKQIHVSVKKYIVLLPITNYSIRFQNGEYHSNVTSQNAFGEGRLCPVTTRALRPANMT